MSKKEIDELNNKIKEICENESHSKKLTSN